MDDTSRFAPTIHSPADLIAPLYNDDLDAAHDYDDIV